MNLRRKRLRLMRDTQWRGYARTAEGNPITLSQIRSVLSLSVLGNSSQSGVPSPDNPLEVVGTGERTGNLFDENKINKQNPTNQDIELNLDNNETYCLFSNINGGKGLIIIYAKTTGTDELKEIARNDTTQRFKNFVVDYTQYSGYILRWFAYSGENSINNIAIYKGSYTADTLPSYEPYGYKVAVTAHGLNLFDAENIIENTEDTAVKIEEYQGKKCLTWTDGSNTNKQRFMQGEFKENTQYTFRFSGYSKNNMQIFIVYTDGSYRGTTIQGGEKWNEIIFQSTSGKSIDYWREWNNYTQKVAIDIESATIIEGAYTADTLPPYEPYKPPQSFNVYTPDVLHGVGDAHDTVILDFDKHKAELVQQYEYFKVDTTQWSGETSNGYNGINTTNRYHAYTNLYSGFYSANDSKCNILQKYNVNIWQKDMQGFTWNENQLHLRINNDILGITANDTREERTAKFRAYTQSNDIYALGKLISPVVRDITALQNWDALPQLRGTWVLTAEGGTEPTLKAKYYSEEGSTE